MNLTLFDLDQTLLAGDSDHMWGQFLVDMGPGERSVYEHANNRFYAQYKAGNLDVHAYQRFALQPLVDNPRTRMHCLRARFVTERVRPAIARHAPALISARRQAGDRIAIITATNSFITAPIVALLGMHQLIAPEPELVDNQYTGAIAGKIGRA